MGLFRVWNKKGQRVKPGGRSAVPGKEAFGWLARRPAGVGRVQRIVRRRTAAERLIEVARGELGVSEVGRNTGPRVRQYQAATTLTGTGWPWCMAFVVFCCKKARVPIAYEGAYVPHLEVLARAHRKWTRIPAAGRLALMDFQGDGVCDHIGIVERVEDDCIIVLEGNTSPEGAGGSQDNGGCVARRRRPRGVIRGYVII